MTVWRGRRSRRRYPGLSRALGLLFTTADPRYVGKDIAEAGSAILNVDEVQQILRDEEHSEQQNRTMCMVDDKPNGLAHPRGGR